MCQVVKSSTLCICIHIIYQKDEGMQESIATYLTEVYQMQIKNPWKKKTDEKTSMHVRFTYPVDTQYMPNLPRVWRMDTDVC